MVASCSCKGHNDPGGHGHTHTAGTPVKENEVAATCTESGSYDLATYCTTCEEEMSRVPMTVDPLGHNLKHVEAKAPTCTEEGYEAYDYCLRCTYTTKQVINPTGHHFVRDEETLEYKCDHEGCNETDGRDYRLDIVHSPTVKENQSIGELFESFSFVNDDGALALGWFLYEIWDGSNLVDMITANKAGGYENLLMYRIGEEYVGKKIYLSVYIVVVDDTNIKYATSDKKTLANVEAFCGETQLFKSSGMTGTTFYDGTTQYGHYYSYSLGTVQKSYDKVVIDNTVTTFTYGYYPQTYVYDNEIINTLNSMTETTINGWYFLDDKFYTKITATPYTTGILFSNGVNINNGFEYWFECEPITWQISYFDSYHLYEAISYNVLDVSNYYEDYEERTIDDKTVYPNNYAHSSLRSWLNGYFLDTAFATGKRYLFPHEVRNSADTTEYNTNPYTCEATVDKVWAFSFQEMKDNSIFKSSNDYRRGYVTDYAKARGVNCNQNISTIYTAAYWTRSPNPNNAFSCSNITYDGSIYAFTNVNTTLGVRPAIEICTSF